MLVVSLVSEKRVENESGGVRSDSGLKVETAPPKWRKYLCATAALGELDFCQSG